MTITITMELTEENLEKLKALLPEAILNVKAEPKTTKKVKVQKQEEATTEPVEQQKEEYAKDLLPQDTAYTEKVTTPPPANIQPKKQEITITKEDIRAAALALSHAGKKDKIAAIFTQFGASKLSDFDNRLESYPALMEALKNAATC